MVINNQKGFALVETAIGIAMISVFLITFSTLTVQSKKVSRSNIDELRAEMYAREQIEIAKDLEFSDWFQLSPIVCNETDGCHPEIMGTSWKLLTGKEVLDGGKFRRWITVEPVYRTSGVANLIVFSADSLQSVLSWSSTNATDVTITGMGSVSVAGTKQVSPASTTIYTITGTNPSGASASATAVVYVGCGTETIIPTSPLSVLPPGASPVSIAIIASPDRICSGSTTVADQFTKKITSRVVWEEGSAEKSMTLEAYVFKI